MREKLAPYIAKDDILRFLQVRSEASAELNLAVDAALDAVFDAAVFRHVRRDCDLVREGGVLSLDGTVPLPYASLAHLFAESTTVYAVCCTIGPDVMRTLRRKLLTDAAGGVILDACASVVADAYAAYLQEQLPELTTKRFSPGYGDVPLLLQRALFRLLEVPGRIGVHLNEGDLMIPEKSVLFLAGNHPKSRAETGCADCGAECAYRKDDA